jgi:hypothetical protein
MSLESAKKHHQRRIWDVQSQEKMQHIIDGKKRLSLVTGPPQIAKSSAVVFSIACQDKTFVVCIHQTQGASHGAVEFAQKTFGKDRKIVRFASPRE